MRVFYSAEVNTAMDKELERVETAYLQPFYCKNLPTDIFNNKLTTVSTTKFPLEKIAALGVAFQPITSTVQLALNGSGGSGIYFVNTMGNKMHQIKGSTEHIGALMAADGGVGGGQARITALPCDPTMLCMAAVLMSIEKKLDDIRQTQEQILSFLEEKERAAIQGNINVLNDIISNYKYNWNNANFKNDKRNIVQLIQKEAEASIILYREQTTKKLQKRSFIHSGRDVLNTLDDLLHQFNDYRNEG